MTATEAKTRFLLLHGLRWLSSGLIIPVIILLMLDRGLSLGQVGLVTAMQGVAVFGLELPTGGLADSFGRRKLLLVASGFSFTSLALMLVADSFAFFALAWTIQGVYRALESGPLDSWYVDAAQADDPAADIEHTLARGGVVLGLTIAVGALAASGLVAWAPVSRVEPLVLPILAALVIVIIEFVAIAMLMREVRDRKLRFRSTLRSVPTVVREAVSAVSASRVLLSLVAVEIFWGFGMTAFELFTPAKLDAILSSADQAAQVVGPTQTAAWIASAAGAALIPRLVARIGGEYAGGLLLLTQALLVAGLALASGPVGVIVAFVMIMTTHGAANPVHVGLLHRAVTDPGRRATVISANSLCARTGGLLGSVGLGLLSDATTLTTAILVGAAVLALAAPFYLLARRARVGTTEGTPDGQGRATTDRQEGATLGP